MPKSTKVTIAQFAKDIGVPPERLHTQLKDAGVNKENIESLITDQEKRILHEHLKSLHELSAADSAKPESEKQISTLPKTITLKRKSLSEIKVSGAQGKRKTVSVEVRKKRT